MSIFVKYAIFQNIFVCLIKDRTFVTVRYLNHRLNLLWVLYIVRVYTGCFLSILLFSGHRSEVISYPFCIVLGTKPHTLYICIKKTRTPELQLVFFNEPPYLISFLSSEWFLLFWEMTFKWKTHWLHMWATRAGSQTDYLKTTFYLCLFFQNQEGNI